MLGMAALGLSDHSRRSTEQWKVAAARTKARRCRSSVVSTPTSRFLSRNQQPVRNKRQFEPNSRRQEPPQLPCSLY